MMRGYIRTEQVTATVTNVKVIGNKQKAYSVQLELPEGKQVKFVMNQGQTEVGAQMPVLVDVYDDGNNHYRYDKIEWIINK